MYSFFEIHRFTYTHSTYSIKNPSNSVNTRLQTLNSILVSYVACIILFEYLSKALVLFCDPHSFKRHLLREAIKCASNELKLVLFDVIINHKILFRRVDGCNASPRGA